MKILFDTNIVLDVLLNRLPHSVAAVKLFSAIENKTIEGVLCATTITTIDYLVSKSAGKSTAKHAIRCLLSLFEIAEVNVSILNSALKSEFSDFEDAVLFYSGLERQIEAVVTRNINDFKPANSPIYTPDALLAVIESMY